MLHGDGGDRMPGLEEVQVMKFLYPEDPVVDYNWQTYVNTSAEERNKNDAAQIIAPMISGKYSRLAGEEDRLSDLWIDANPDPINVVDQFQAGDGFKLQYIECVGHWGFFVQQIADTGCCRKGEPGAFQGQVDIAPVFIVSLGATSKDKSLFDFRELFQDGDGFLKIVFG